VIGKECQLAFPTTNNYFLSLATMKEKKAFTLIELMVAMGIIGVLMTMSILGISIVQQSLRNTQRRDIMNSTNLAVNTYFGNFGVFPDSSQVAITQDAIYIDGNKITDLKGPTRASLQFTNDQFTQYCFESTGGSYSLGSQIEGSTNWDIQLGNSGQKCTTARVDAPPAQ
jgi:prepilin-type N-terminal cleavage/methylation domain-containing protein